MSTKKDRIPAAERRELILAAATEVFGSYGYAGTTTDQVARAAGISQPYVVRMFGSKENLFIEVLERTCQRIVDTFRAVIADPEPIDDRPLATRIGRAYIDLVRDRGIMLMLMQGFLLGQEPRIGAVARDGFMRIYRLLRDEAGFDPEKTRQFLANGMLINTVLGAGLVARVDSEPDVPELLDCLFGEKLGLVLEAEKTASAAR